MILTAMKRLIVYLLILISSPVSSYEYNPENDFFPASASGHWVFFSDKKGVEFDPYSFFDAKAIERRQNLRLNIYDTIDFPVRSDYLSLLTDYVDSLDVVSRWFNAAHVYASHVQLADVESLSFVDSVRPASLRLLVAANEDEADGQSLLARADTALLNAQLRHLTGHLFFENKYNGAGKRIAIFDAGFRGVKTHPAFRHLVQHDRIIASYDFHRERENVYIASTHGTMVLSAIAGMLDGHPMGLATGAEFLLARTEIRREPLAEEKYWLAAVEWADRHGADIINSSLGYIYHRYYPEEMDGKTSLVAHAANIAARKGILIVNSAGNQGNDEHWRIIVTPADADSVLTVGALDYPSMLHADYSSAGPTADGRMKPNVSVLGNIVAASRRRLVKPHGTSFASPLVTGFAACLWQMYPDWTNMDVFSAIERSATLYPYFDYAHGHGIPQASAFFDENMGFRMPTFDIIAGNDSIKIVLRKMITGDESASNSAIPENKYLYYHKRNADGSIDKYYVVDLEDVDHISIARKAFVKGQQLFVHFNGYTSGILVK